MNTEDIKNILRNIPNSVSGDGKTFVAALKNYLTKYGLVTDEKIDSALEELTKKPNHVDSITLLELHAITDGVRSNNIQINWDTTPVSDYAKAEIWYTRAADSAWEKAGEASGAQYVLQGATAGETYHIRVIAVNSKGVAADFDTAPMANITIKGSQYIPSPPTQFVLTWDEQGPLWKWLFDDNNYVDFFELRLDQNPGVWNDKRLDSTRETWSRANPDVRAGTAYLYIRNIFGEYSEPAVHQFNKAMPSKPEAPVLTATLDGVRIKMSPLPQGATGYKIHIKTSDGVEDDFTTVNSEYIYFFFLGKITVKYCIVDTLGDGEWSDEATCDIKAGIDVGQVPTIDYDKLGDTVKTAIDIANKQPDVNIGFGNNIKDINADIGNIKTNITNINSTIDGLDVASINATMAELDKNITANTSSIQQNANSITAVVTRVDSAEKNITQHGTAIQQNADSITALAKKVTTVEGSVTENTTAIQQNATDITSLAKRVTTNAQGITANTSSIQQNADGISAVVKRVTTVEGEVTAHGTAINQTADSIAAVVTELNKKPADCNYSSISMLQDDILLAVKKDGVINAINISTEEIVIDGNKVHITGDTVFDNNVIVGGMIAADSIALKHLKANSVSSAKIQADAITADKIAAGAVTADKIEAGAITAEKLAAGSVTSDAIQAGSVIGDKIAANAITAENMAANSVTANAIQAGSVDAEKLKAGDIDLLGALAIVGGAARLDKNGLKITDSEGGYILYNSDGMSYYDADNYRYAQVKRMVIGSASHGEHVSFNHPWAFAPIVLCSPTDTQIAQSTYQQANIKLVCKAVNITKTGFDVQCYTTIMSGSGSGNSDTQTLSGGESTAFSFSVPSTATSIDIPLSVSANVIKGTGTFKYYYKNNYNQWVTNGDTIKGDVYPWVYAKAAINVNGSEKSSWQSSSIYSKNGATSLNESTTLSATFSAGSTIAVVIQLVYGFQNNMPSTANYQWRYVSGGNIPSGTATVSSNYSTSANQVISTGSVFFLCIDANSSAYTVS